MSIPGTDVDMSAGSGVVSGKLVRLSGEHARIGAPSHNHSSGGPQIQLIRDGDTLRAIDIKCTCGEHIRLRCVYDTGAN